MINILQTNLRRSPGEHDLLVKCALEKSISIFLTTEPNKAHVRDDEDWYKDKNCDSAIKVLDTNLRVVKSGSGKGFTWVVIGGCQIFSCYISPNVTFNAFKVCLYDLQKHIRESGYHDWIVVGDLNSKSYQWGSHVEDDRGTYLSEWFAEMDLEVVNTGNAPTFIGAKGSSIVDITACSSGFLQKISGWYASDEENLSDHQNIYFNLNLGQQQRLPLSGEYEKIKYKYEDRKRALLQEVLQKKLLGILPTPENCVKIVQEACEEVLNAPTKKYGQRKRVYWWNEKIKERRKLCHKERRNLVRLNRRDLTAEQRKILKDRYYRQKEELRQEIIRSKQEKNGFRYARISIKMFGETHIGLFVKSSSCFQKPSSLQRKNLASRVNFFQIMHLKTGKK